MTYPVVRELADDPDLRVSVAVACRVLKVSSSGSTSGATGDRRHVISSKRT
jgi:hypothetical protein